MLLRRVTGMLNTLVFTHEPQHTVYFYGNQIMRQSYNLSRGNFLLVNIHQRSELACWVRGSGNNHHLSSSQSEARHGDPHRILFKKASTNNQIYNGVTIQYCSLGN